MIDSAGGPRLAEETLPDLGLEQGFGQWELEGNRAVELRVDRQEDDSESPCALAP